MCSVAWQISTFSVQELGCDIHGSQDTIHTVGCHAVLFISAASSPLFMTRSLPQSPPELVMRGTRSPAGDWWGCADYARAQRRRRHGLGLGSQHATEAASLQAGWMSAGPLGTGFLGLVDSRWPFSGAPVGDMNLRRLRYVMLLTANPPPGRGAPDSRRPANRRRRR